MNLEQDHSFYELMNDAELYLVSFPCNSDGEGPFWNGHGALEKFPNGYQEHSELMMVHLGNDTYRLAVNPIFQPPSTLHWGDEFFARQDQSNSLEITHVKTNQRFKHTSILMHINSDHPMSKKIHELGGGWECVAVGISTISIPQENWKQFREQFESWTRTL